MLYEQYLVPVSYTHLDVYKRQGQTYLLNNPFKIIAEREAKEQASRDMEKQKRRALNKAQKKKK